MLPISCFSRFKLKSVRTEIVYTEWGRLCMAQSLHTHHYIPTVVHGVQRNTCTLTVITLLTSL